MLASSHSLLEARLEYTVILFSMVQLLPLSRHLARPGECVQMRVLLGGVCVCVCEVVSRASGSHIGVLV